MIKSSTTWIKPSTWWITSKNFKTGELKTRLCKFDGPFPLKDELEYYCPNDICVIVEIKCSNFER